MVKKKLLKGIYSTKYAVITVPHRTKILRIMMFACFIMNIGQDLYSKKYKIGRYY